MVGDAAGLLWEGGVPRCRGDVLAGPCALPMLRDVDSAALRFRTAVPAEVVVAGRASGFLLVDVVLPGGARGAALADDLARDLVSRAVFSTDTLDARVLLLVVGPAWMMVGGVFSGVLLRVPPPPPKDGEKSAAAPGDLLGGTRVGLVAPLFSRGTLCDLRLLDDPAVLVVVGGVTEGLLVVAGPPPDDVGVGIRASLDAGDGRFLLAAPRCVEDPP